MTFHSLIFSHYYTWVKWRVPDPSLVPFPFDCAGSQLVSKKFWRLHFVLEEITSPFQWCKAFRANSILPEYNGSNPNEGQSALGIICFPKYLFKLLSDASRYIPHFPHSFFCCLSTQAIAGTVPDPLNTCDLIAALYWCLFSLGRRDSTCFYWICSVPYSSICEIPLPSCFIFFTCLCSEVSTHS